MKSIKFKVSLIVAGVMVAVTIILQLYNGYYFLRDMSRVISYLPTLGVVCIMVLVVTSSYFFVYLRFISKVDGAILSGAEVSHEDRLKARRSITGISSRIFVFSVANFVVGPIVMILSSIAKGSTEPLYSHFLIFLFNAVMGFACALEQVFLVERVMIPVKQRLGIISVEGLKRDMSFRGKFMIISLTAVVLAIVFLGLAGFGFVREFARKGLVIKEGVWIPYFIDIGILGILIFIWAFSLVRVVATNVQTQMQYVNARIVEMAKGGGDLTARIAVANVDEIGTLTASVNDFMGSLQQLLLSLHSVSDTVSGSADELGTLVEKSGESMKGLKLSVGDIGSASGKQFGAITSAKTQIDHMKQSIDVISEQLSAQASFVEQSSASVAEMAANTTSVTRLTERASDVSRKLKDTSVEGDAAIADTRASIKVIADSSHAVSDIIKVIQKISAQTNLLAMNAAIEAAHAGDAGMGFAVVANEVRSLAESSAKSAREVVALIKDMTRKIDGGVSTSDRASSAFARISEGVSESTELVSTIAASMEEQKLAADEILSAMTHMVDATHKIKDMSTEQKEQSETMQAAIGNIVKASEEIGDALKTGAVVTGDFDALLGEVGSHSAKNKDSVGNLKKLVDGFKLG